MFTLHFASPLARTLEASDTDYVPLDATDVTGAIREALESQWGTQPNDWCIWKDNRVVAIASQRSRYDLHDRIQGIVEVIELGGVIGFCRLLFDVTYVLDEHGDYSYTTVHSYCRQHAAIV